MKDQHVSISAPNMIVARFGIEGTAPYVQLAFNKKIGDKPPPGKKPVRAPRDFEGDARRAQHISTDGWAGIPAAAFRAAMISACRLVGYKMTILKSRGQALSKKLSKPTRIELIALYLPVPIAEWPKLLKEEAS